MNDPELADLFWDDAKMTTQDKQNLQGKPAVLRQFEKGAWSWQAVVWVYLTGRGLKAV